VNKNQRVVVTGLGVASCFGNDVDDFYEKLLCGESGVKKISQFDVEEFPTQFAAAINDFDTEDLIDRKQARRIDKFIAYALVAGKKALAQAGITEENARSLNSPKLGAIIGSGMGGMQIFYDGVVTLRDKGVRRMNPFFVPFVITNMSGALLAMDYGFMGPNYSLSTACATGNYSIINAANHIRSGMADLIVTGGVEAPINSIGLGGFCACRALSSRNDSPEEASRPFDKARDGFVMGEGAGILVLESLEHAEKRGAKILAEYLGGGVTCDAHHMTEPRGDGLGVKSCVEEALKDAGIDESAIDYINAHATSTPLGDVAELNAVNQVFSQPEKIYMNATKSMIGHGLGAAGGLEAVVSVKALETGEIHPTINLTDPEEGIRFQLPTKRTKAPIKAALSNSFGFGGHNASIIFSKFE